MAYLKLSLQGVDELTAEDGTEYVDRQEEGIVGMDPAAVIWGQTSGGDHAVDMRVSAQILTPGMQDDLTVGSSEVSNDDRAEPSTEHSSTNRNEGRDGNNAAATPPAITSSTNSKVRGVVNGAKLLGVIGDVVDLGKDMVRVSAIKRAYHQSSWLSEVIATNTKGKLGGMVKSAKARVIYLLAGGEDRGTIPPDIRSALEDVERYEYYLTVAFFAAGVVEDLPRIIEIAHSRSSYEHKGLRLAGIASTAAMRAWAGAVPFGAHAIYKGFEGYCMIGGLIATRSVVGATHRYGQVFRNADTLVQSTFKTITEADNQWWLITTVVSPRAKVLPSMKKALQSVAAARDGLRY